MSQERDPDIHTRSRLDAFVAGVQRTGVDSAALLDPAAVEMFTAAEAAGLEVLLLKGPGLERLLYGPGERRAYGDIDLLVAPDHHARVAELLGRLGYHNASAELGIEDVGGVVHAETWVGMPGGASQQIVAEVHRWLPGAAGNPDEAWPALWAARTTIELEGHQIPVLDRPGQALQLATHAAQHGPGFVKGLRELRLALDRWSADVWREATALAVAVEAVDAFAVGLRLTAEGSRLAENLGLPVNPAAEWEVRNADRRPRGAFHVEAFRDARTLGERLSVVRKALLPTRAWILSEYRWARPGALRLAAAYALHMVRAPLWATRALWFRRRAPRGGA